MRAAAACAGRRRCCCCCEWSPPLTRHRHRNRRSNVLSAAARECASQERRQRRLHSALLRRRRWRVAAAAGASHLGSYDDPDDYELGDDEPQAQPTLATTDATSEAEAQGVAPGSRRGPAVAVAAAVLHAWGGCVNGLGALLEALLACAGWLLALASWPVRALWGWALGQLVPEATKRRWSGALKELPEGFWPKLHWLWERPLMKSIHITFSVANWGVRIPAILALILTQGSIIASQVSLPMLAPLLLGSGMLFRSIKANASFIMPRVGMMVVLLWCIWFLNSVVQNTWIILSSQGRIDARTTAGLITLTECVTLVLAGIVVLSMIGVNISGLLLPAGICAAIACKELVQNLLAGFFIFIVQPFRIGDRVSVSCSSPPSQKASGFGGNSWFEGVCEKVDLRCWNVIMTSMRFHDLRYTMLRNGKRRLMVPNTAFVTREFIVEEQSEDILKQGSTNLPSYYSNSHRQPTPDEQNSVTENESMAQTSSSSFWMHRDMLSQHSMRFGMHFDQALANAYAAGTLARSADGGYIEDGHPASHIPSTSWSEPNPQVSRARSEVEPHKSKNKQEGVTDANTNGRNGVNSEPAGELILQGKANGDHQRFGDDCKSKSDIDGGLRNQHTIGGDKRGHNT